MRRDRMEICRHIYIYWAFHIRDTIPPWEGRQRVQNAGPVNKSKAPNDPLKHLFEREPMKGINQARGHSHLLFVQIFRTSFFSWSAFDSSHLRWSGHSSGTEQHKDDIPRQRFSTDPKASDWNIISSCVPLVGKKQQKLVGEGPVSSPKGIAEGNLLSGSTSDRYLIPTPLVWRSVRKWNRHFSIKLVAWSPGPENKPLTLRWARGNGEGGKKLKVETYR